MKRLFGPGLAALLCAKVMACSSSDVSDPASCLTLRRSAIVSGTSDETYLGISKRQVRAIVRIDDGTGPDAPACTGIFVSPTWVLTAKHCLQIQPAVITSADGAGRAAVTRSVEHPALDVALVNVAFPDIGADWASIAPSVTPASIDDLVELAGYGLTEDAQPSGLRFVLEPVTGMTESTYRVEGFGVSGACRGDSGGPLLIRDQNGAVAVAGVMSTGSITCRHGDTYVRVDAIRDWIGGAVESLAPEDRDCGALTTEGRCLYRMAVWCGDGQLRATPCASDTACGWDVDSAAFRCVRPSVDPCAGVDAVGTCHDGSALHCRQGQLQREACAACGFTCSRDGKTGSAECESGS
jgi:hypothetical protein